jgi:hypothetical protein
VYVTWWDARNGTNDIFFNASSDGGQTWLAADLQLDTAPGASTNPRICSSGAFVYVAWMDQRAGSADIHFNYSTNNGLGWQPLDIRLDNGDLPGVSTSDMVDLACDGANVYAVWRDLRSGTGSGDIYFNSSPNNGATWLTQDVRLDADFVLGSHASYDPHISARSGNIYVVYADNRHGNPDVYFRYSLNNGATWYGRDIRLDTGDYAGANGSTSPRIKSTGGHVYVVWQDTRNGATDIHFNNSANNGISWRDGADDGDIMLARSTNGGATWGTPVRVNNDVGTTGQFQPWIDVKPGGAIDVVWYDRRNDAANDSWLDVYMGTSTDRGQTFVNQRVSDLSFGPPPPPSVWPWPWMGEYIGIDVDATTAYVVWTDTRNSDRDIYFDRIFSATVAVALIYFDVEWKNNEGVVRWQVSSPSVDHVGFHVYRSENGGPREQLTTELLSGRSEYEFVDEEVPSSGAEYWLREQTSSGTEYWYGPRELPSVAAPPLELSASYPNPFNPQTTITYSIPDMGLAQMTVYDVRGRVVKELLREVKPAGEHSLTWDGTNEGGEKVASGVYYVRLEFDGSVRSHKITMLK